MTIPKILVIDGRTCVQRETNHCAGCAGEHNNNLCDKLPCGEINWREVVHNGIYYVMGREDDNLICFMTRDPKTYAEACAYIKTVSKAWRPFLVEVVSDEELT